MSCRNSPCTLYNSRWHPIPIVFTLLFRMVENKLVPDYRSCLSPTLNSCTRILVLLIGGNISPPPSHLQLHSSLVYTRKIQSTSSSQALQTQRVQTFGLLMPYGFTPVDYGSKFSGTTRNIFRHPSNVKLVTMKHWETDGRAISLLFFWIQFFFWGLFVKINIFSFSWLLFLTCVCVSVWSGCLSNLKDRWRLTFPARVSEMFCA